VVRFAALLCAASAWRYKEKHDRTMTQKISVSATLFAQYKKGRKNQPAPVVSAAGSHKAGDIVIEPMALATPETGTSTWKGIYGSTLEK